jgi:serine protease AprX
MAKRTMRPGETRASALWGSGNGSRGGEHRSSALWGRGGRGAALVLAFACALLAPVAAFASSRGGGNGPQNGWARQFGGATGGGIADSTFVQNALWQQAKQHGDQRIRVIVQGVNGASSAENAFGKAGDRGDGDRMSQKLALIGGVAIDIRAKRLAKLAQNPNLIITPDAPVESTGLSSAQLWPYTTGLSQLWGTLSQPAPSAPTIAIVDSGLQVGRADFTGRTYPQVNFSSLGPTTAPDDRGHGTFVAGIAAGAAGGYAGAAPGAKILPIRVMDGTGVARTSDVIAACQWILANKDAYNIRVANFSLHSGTATHFYFDPLDRAVEKLWFNGVTVVTAAGNYGTGSTPSGVVYSPGNDPFVITVGAVDLGASPFRYDDTVAPWSAYGYTEDGFAKPELAAPGRFMIGPVPAGSTLVQQRPDHVVGAGYMQLSGTSFAAPVVSGAAAQLVARHPGWTPDQVKGALMLTAKPVPGAAPLAAGVGEISAAQAAWLSSAPNPNAAAEQFVKVDPVSGGATFDFTSWAAAAHASSSWDAASWSDASWADASWSDASWADASWSDASWADASWSDASWADASWADASWADSSREDGALDGVAPSLPAADADTIAALAADPEISAPLP